MPHLRLILAAAAVACLFGGAAFANADLPSATDTGASPPVASDQPTAPVDPATVTTDQAPMPQAPAAATSATDSSANVGVQVIASQPVPDTPENRAKYGQPMSHAGKHTRPAGN